MQAGGDYGVDYLAEAVIPFVENGVLQFGIGVGIVSNVVPAER